jgi:hypothetical protein
MHYLAPYGGPVDTASWDSILSDVRTQIGNASAGRVLASGSGGESHRTWSYSAPVDEATAEALVAYWLAVGARVGYPGLLSAARSFYARADGRVKLLSSSDASRITSVIDEGVRALDAVNAFKDKRMAGIYRGLGMNRRADEIKQSQDLAYQQSNAYIIKGTIKDSAKKVGKGLEKVGRVITNEKPPGTPTWLWWIQRNAILLGVGAATLGVAYIYLRPVLAPLFKVRDAAAAASGRAADKAVARIDQVARNPRRRRRLRRSRR